MLRLLRPRSQRKGAIADVEFEGEPYGAGVSFFLGNALPGRGPQLHKHPYAEVCIVRSGQAAMTVDGRDIVADAGDIVVIGPGTLHRFVAIGDARLDMVCIHANSPFIIEWLSDRRGEGIDLRRNTGDDALSDNAEITSRPVGAPQVLQDCDMVMEKAMKTKASVLLVGLEPDIVDYSKSPVPGLTAAKVRAALEADSSKLESLGYRVRFTVRRRRNDS